MNEGSKTAIDDDRKITVNVPDLYIELKETPHSWMKNRRPKLPTPDEVSYSLLIKTYFIAQKLIKRSRR